ncbi:hypothetical protein EXIGLDRAFT_732259 [Exidia glandulosa HHB12029]|uniref:Uncharacterized protein n=1 Tax=Exidia glandulosa HHB12029 TaxID=1314781 RepID=A0A165BKW9_EXIGL|nr:hypothetical protein EXIGLDRAFT_732259 [Exidia glandulosa HHB12029]
MNTWGYDQTVERAKDRKKESNEGCRQLCEGRNDDECTHRGSPELEVAKGLDDGERDEEQSECLVE